MNWDVFVTCAVTGAGDTTAKSAKVPVSPKEIAVIGCGIIGLTAAITAQRALTDRSANVDEAMGRLGLLLAVIDFHSQTLDAW